MGKEISSAVLAFLVKEGGEPPPQGQDLRWRAPHRPTPSPPGQATKAHYLASHSPLVPVNVPELLPPPKTAAAYSRRTFLGFSQCGHTPARWASSLQEQPCERSHVLPAVIC